MSTFWRSATQEQKLAQIDAGIAIDATLAALSINLGASPNTIRDFAYARGRKFGMNPRSLTGASLRHGAYRNAEMERLSQEYFSGEPVDFWR